MASMRGGQFMSMETKARTRAQGSVLFVVVGALAASGCAVDVDAGPEVEEGEVATTQQAITFPTVVRSSTSIDVPIYNIGTTWLDPGSFSWNHYNVYTKSGSSMSAITGFPFVRIGTLNVDMMPSGPQSDLGSIKDPFKVDRGFAESSHVWIDCNSNGTFEASEKQQLTSQNSANWPVWHTTYHQDYSMNDPWFDAYKGSGEDFAMACPGIGSINTQARIMFVKNPAYFVGATAPAYPTLKTPAEVTSASPIWAYYDFDFFLYSLFTARYSFDGTLASETSDPSVAPPATLGTSASPTTTGTKVGTGALAITSTAKFDMNAYADLGANIAQFGVGDFTIAHWIKTAFNSGLGDVIGNRVDGSHGNFVCARINAAGIVSFEVDQSSTGTNYVGVAATTPVNNGAWHHLAYVRSGATVRIYVDGALQGTATAASGKPANIASSNSLRAGRRLPVDYAGYYSISATYDDVRVYGRALSASEITALQTP
jgi:hypothetical protein